MTAPEQPPANVLAATLAAIEADRRPEAGALFVETVCRALRLGAGTETAEARPAAPRLGPPPAAGRPLAEVVRDLERDLFDGRLWPGHPALLSAPLPVPLPASVWSEALIGAMNQQMRVEAMSPTGTPLETELVRWMARLVGWGERAGGTFTSGATESSFSALLAARARILPAAWTDGIGPEPPVVLATPGVHFSIQRALGELGLGTRCLEIVSPGTLDHRLQDHARVGRRVMAVVATAGAFATGAFDDLEAIGAACDAHGVWLHVDAAIGGAALLSATHRSRLAGIERAASVAWDLHKLSMMPLQAGVLLVRDERLLERAFAPGGEAVAAVRSPDQCDRSFQNSRRCDAVKLWVALQRHGVAGLGALYDRLCGLAGELHRQVSARRELEVLSAPESSHVVFRYVGDRSLDEPALDLVNRQIWSEAARDRLAVMSLVRLDGRIRFVAVMANPFLREDQLAALLDRLVDLGTAARPELGS